MTDRDPATRAPVPLHEMDHRRVCHPEEAAVGEVPERAELSKKRIVPLAPQPEKLELTLARITSVVGEGKAGAPELLDTHRPGAFRMTRFSAKEVDAPGSVVCSEPRLAVRLFRPALR